MGYTSDMKTVLLPFLGFGDGRIEAGSTETTVRIYQTTRHHIQKMIFMLTAARTTDIAH
jgi:hypothetical protein